MQIQRLWLNGFRSYVDADVERLRAIREATGPHWQIRIDANAGYDADTAIAIRTALIKDGIGYVQAGAGVVADSDPVYEDTEARNKAMAVLSAIASAHTLRTIGGDDQ